jgi:putative ABC transport system permease protein
MKPLTAFRLSIRNIIRRPGRSICLAAVSALLSFALAGGSLLAECLKNGTKSMSDRLGADALIVPGGYEAKAQGALLRGEPSAFFFEGELAEKLLDSYGIEQASPQLFIATLDSDHCAFPVQMIGYDPKTDFVVAPWLSQSVPGGPAKGEVIVGADIDGRKGETLEFFGEYYLVAGKLEKTGIGFDTTVFLNMDQAREALADYADLVGAYIPEGAISSISVNVSPEVDISDFSRRIRYGFRDEDVGVVLTQAMLGNISSKMDSFLSVIRVIAGFLWVASIGVLAILFAAILGERKREFGIYRALGASRKKLSVLVLIEASLVSLAGSLVGTALLSLFYFSLNALIGLSIDMPYLAPTSAGTIAWLLGSAIAASFLAGPAASLFTAARIGKMATDAIMREGE